jgi:hypothetical protein
MHYLIAKEPAPSFVANALPGFLARPVLASRVSDALIAQSARPSVLAPGNVARIALTCTEPGLACKMVKKVIVVHLNKKVVKKW